MPAADPANRLAAGKLEARWNQALARVSELAGKIAAYIETVSATVADLASLATLALDLKAVPMFCSDHSMGAGQRGA